MNIFNIHIKQLTDQELKILISVSLREQRRRKKIIDKNNEWIGNKGLIHVLEASLKKK
jgi:hypothetical protein